MGWNLANAIPIRLVPCVAAEFRDLVIDFVNGWTGSEASFSESARFSRNVPGAGIKSHLRDNKFMHAQVSCKGNVPLGWENRSKPSGLNFELDEAAATRRGRTLGCQNGPQKRTFMSSMSTAGAALVSGAYRLTAIWLSTFRTPGCRRIRLAASRLDSVDGDNPVSTAVPSVVRLTLMSESSGLVDVNRLKASELAFASLPDCCAAEAVGKPKLMRIVVRISRGVEDCCD